MGFIEELRRKKAEQEELQRQQHLRIYGDLRIQREEREAEEQRLKAMEDKARKYFQESGLGEMLAEVAELIGEHSSSYGYQGNYISRLQISLRGVGDKIEVKSIEIETDAEGTIRFRAGFLGSSTINQPLWKNNRDALEKALDKAYSHPRIERYRAGSSSTRPPDVGPGI